MPARAALAAVEPARAGMAAGLTNTLRQVGTATGVAVLGALYASRITPATLHALAGLPAPPGTARRLAAAVASGAGTRVAAAVPPAARAAVSHAARAQPRPRRTIRPASPRPPGPATGRAGHNGAMTCGQARSAC